MQRGLAWYWFQWLTKVSICAAILFFCCVRAVYQFNRTVHAAVVAETIAWLPLEGPVPTPASPLCTPRLRCIRSDEDRSQRAELLPPAIEAASNPPMNYPEPRFEQGYKYYMVDRLGLFDMTHIRHGKEQMQEVLRQIRSGYVQLSFVTQESLTTGKRFRIIGFYRVRQNLTREQLNQSALGIVMDFEHLIELHQTPGSSYSLEDLPSDYIGYFLALHPHWSAEELLMRLDADQRPVGFNKVSAHLYKSFQRNEEFLPVPAPGEPPVSWPRLLYMEPIGPWNGYWVRTTFLVTPDERAWWQRWGDWGLKAYDVML